MSKHIQKFGNANETYDTAAELQLFVAKRLAEQVADCGFSGGALLEIGCGTGFLTGELQRQFGHAATMLVTDAASKMVESCRARFSDAANMRFAVMDGEKPDVAPYSFDRIVSSMTIQWFENPSKTLEDLLLCLKPDGIIHYATTGCDNFMEWREHLAQRGLDCAQRQMPKKLPGMCREELITRDYKNGRGFIDMLRKTGADAPKPDYVRPAPRAFLEAVDSFDGKVTWHIISGQMQLKI